MNINFSNDKNGTSKATMKEGTFEDMVKMRKKQLPEIQASIQEMFKDYDGGMVAILTVKEDENGHAEGHNLFIGGVAHISQQLQMGKAFSQASDQMRDMLIENAAGNPKALKAVLMGLVSEMISDLDDEPKGKK